MHTNLEGNDNPTDDVGTKVKKEKKGSNLHYSGQKRKHWENYDKQNHETPQLASSTFSSKGYERSKKSRHIRFDRKSKHKEVPTTYDEENTPEQLLYQMNHMFKHFTGQDRDLPNVYKAYEKLQKLVWLTNFDDLSQNRLNYTVDDIQSCAYKILRRLSQSMTDESEKILTIIKFIQESEHLTLITKHINLFIKHLMNRFQTYKAIEQFQHMKGNYNLDPNYHTFKILLNGCISSHKLNYCLDIIRDLIRHYSPIMDSRQEKGQEVEIDNEASDPTESEDGIGSIYLLFVTVIEALIAHSEIDKANEIFQMMKNLKWFEIKINLYNKFMEKYVKTDQREKVQKLFNELIQDKHLNIQPDSYTYNLVIENYCNQNRMDDAEVIFDLMKKNGVNPDVHTMNHLLRGYSMIDQLERIEQLFFTFDKLELKPNRMSYMIYLEALIRYSSIEEAEKLLQSMIKDEIQPDIGVCNIMIKGYMNHNEVSKANQFVEKMKREYNIYPNQFTYTILSSQYESSDSLVDVKTFLQNFTQYGEFHKYQPYSLSITLKLISESDEYISLFRDVHFTTSMALFRTSMDTKKINEIMDIWINVHGEQKVDKKKYYNFLTSSCLKAKNLEECRDYFVRATKENATSAGIYSNMILLLILNSEIENALRLIDEASGKQFILYNQVFYSLCRTYMSQNRIDEVMSLITKSTEMKIQLTSAFFNIINQYHAKNGDIKMAESTFQTMLKYDVSPDPLSYALLIYCYDQYSSTNAYANNENSAFDIDEVIERMKHDGFGTDIITLNEIAKGYAVCEITEIDALELISRASRIMNINITVSVISTMISFYCDSLTTIDKAEDLLQNMKKFGLKADTLCFQSLIAALVYYKQIDRASTLYKCMRSHGLKANRTILLLLKDGYIRSINSNDNNKATRERYLKELSLLWNEMKTRNITGGLVSYVSLCQVLLKEKSLEEADFVLKQMIASKIVPFALQFKQYIERTVHSSRYSFDELLAFVKGLFQKLDSEYRVHPIDELSAPLLELCVKHKSPESAQKVIDLMKSFNIQPRQSTFAKIVPLIMELNGMSADEILLETAPSVRKYVTKSFS